MSGAIFYKEDTKMQNSVAKIIKAISVIIFILGIIVTVLLVLLLFKNNVAVQAGVIRICVGIFVSFVVSMLILGFSELIEKTDESSRYQKEVLRIMSNFEIKGVPTYTVDPDLTNSSAIQVQNSQDKYQVKQ